MRGALLHPSINTSSFVARALLRAIIGGRRQCLGSSIGCSLRDAVQVQTELRSSLQTPNACCDKHTIPFSFRVRAQVFLRRLS